MLKKNAREVEEAFKEGKGSFSFFSQRNTHLMLDDEVFNLTDESYVSKDELSFVAECNIN